MESGPPTRTRPWSSCTATPALAPTGWRWSDAVGGVGRAVAVDMPGFGQADKPRDFRYQVSSYADFLQGALEQLGIARVHLVVHDFGGPFGLVWGLQHPGPWASVVLIDVGILPDYRWHAMARRWRTPVLGELLQAWIPRWAWRRAMQRNNPKGLPAQFVDKMYDDYDRATRRAVLALYRATPDPGERAAESRRRAGDAAQAGARGVGSEGPVRRCALRGAPARLLRRARRGDPPRQRALAVSGRPAGCGTRAGWVPAHAACARGRRERGAARGRYALGRVRAEVALRSRPGRIVRRARRASDLRPRRWR